MACYAVIPAAGIGARSGLALPKQYAKLGDKTILERSVDKILSLDFVDALAVVVSKDDPYIEQQAFRRADYSNDKPIDVVIGGDTRAQSVRNGVQYFQTKLSENFTNDSWILVHDAARPLVSDTDLNGLFEKIQNSTVGGLLMESIVGTVKDVSERPMKTLDRSVLWQAQTPQIFRSELLKQALASGFDAGSNNIEANFTDEASFVEYYLQEQSINEEILFVEGGRENIKITTPADLLIANAYIMQQE